MQLLKYQLHTNAVNAAKTEDEFINAYSNYLKESAYDETLSNDDMVNGHGDELMEFKAVCDAKRRQLGIVE
jgi:hypothetical protein